MGANLNRFLRNKDLIDQAKLNSATVIGAGGIGSALIQGASIMGFKKLKLLTLLSMIKYTKKINMCSFL